MAVYMIINIKEDYMKKLKYGDVVKVLTDKEIFTGYDKR